MSDPTPRTPASRYAEIDGAFDHSGYTYLFVDPGVGMVSRRARGKKAVDPDTGIEWYGIDERTTYLDGFEIREVALYSLTRYCQGYTLFTDFYPETGLAVSYSQQGTKMPTAWIEGEVQHGRLIIEQFGEDVPIHEAQGLRDE